MNKIIFLYLLKFFCTKSRIIGIGLCDNSGLPGDQRLNAAVRYGKTPDELAGENLSKEMLKRAERGNGMIMINTM